jgi:hypothetical protein
MPAALFGILLSALQSILGFVLRSVTIKFVLFWFLYLVVREIVPILTSYGFFPGAAKAAALNSSLLGIPSGVWYFLDLMNFSMGVSAVLSAYVTRFIIRRIPFIG